MIRARNLFLVFSLGPLFLSLAACNMPVAGRYPSDVSETQLRQTISAQLQSTAISGTSEPNSTGQTQPGEGNLPANPEPGTGALIYYNPPGVDYANPAERYDYIARPGDTLEALASRFGVEPYQIQSTNTVPESGLIPPGQQLEIPNVLEEVLPAPLLLPDSEVLNSPSSVGFDIRAYLDATGGYLSAYQETVNGQIFSGAEIVERVSIEASVSPRILLAFLEFRSGWVTQGDVDPQSIRHPIGFHVPDYQGLYLELVLTGTQLNAGYYGWRNGSLTELKFPDGTRVHLNPTINAGTAGVQNLFSKFYRQPSWLQVLYDQGGFLELYIGMFGDPWARAVSAEPLFPADLIQPPVELPFPEGERWSLTGGPHYSWNAGSPRGALDFAPVTGEPACAVSRAWVTASAPGTIVRSAHNVVVIDLDGDGHEQTGWNIVYLHISERDKIASGSAVQVGTQIGHPSCERGKNTGTHVHIARKYNGEWLFADARVPFILSGWTVQVGERNYQGTLVKDGQTVSANPGGNASSIIIR